MFNFQPMTYKLTTDAPAGSFGIRVNAMPLPAVGDVLTLNQADGQARRFTVTRIDEDNRPAVHGTHLVFLRNEKRRIVVATYHSDGQIAGLGVPRTVTPHDLSDRQFSALGPWHGSSQFAKVVREYAQART